MKRIVCFWLVISILFVMSACGSTSDSELTPQEEVEATNSTREAAEQEAPQPSEETIEAETVEPMDDVDSANLEAIIGFSLTEASQKARNSYSGGGKVFIMQGDRIYPITSDYARIYSEGGNETYDYMYLRESEDTIPILSLQQGDTLVTFEDNESYIFYFAWDDGYCCPVRFRYYENALIGPYGGEMPGHISLQYNEGKRL